MFKLILGIIVLTVIGLVALVVIAGYCLNRWADFITGQDSNEAKWW